MFMQVLIGLQVVLGCLLMAAILIQQKGAGMGAAFGESSNVYTTKRGVDKAVYVASIVLAVLFFGLGIATVLLA
jgi:preprotein translocase subunit SecG